MMRPRSSSRTLDGETPSSRASTPAPRSLDGETLRTRNTGTPSPESKSKSKPKNALKERMWGFVKVKPTVDARVEDLEIQLRNAELNNVRLHRLFAEKEKQLRQANNMAGDQLFSMFSAKVREVQRKYEDRGRALKAQKEAFVEALDRERERIAELEDTVREQEMLIAKSQGTPTPILAECTASDLPDSAVREQLDDFFAGSLRSWCRENSVDRLKQPEEVAKQLVELGILFRDPVWGSHWQFDVTSDGAPAMLLLAAISSFLCRRFLGNPFFLAGPADAEMLLAAEQEFKKANLWGALKWRSQTIARIKDCIPPTLDEFRIVVQSLIDDLYPILIGDDFNGDELLTLVHRFANLTLRLWTLRTRIIVKGGAAISRNHTFRSDSLTMEADVSLGLQDGDTRLDGRPICVVVRPLIVSFPLSAEDRNHAVLWSKASVWISTDD